MVLLVCFVSFDTRCRFNFFNELSPRSVRIFYILQCRSGCKYKTLFLFTKPFTYLFFYFFIAFWMLCFHCSFRQRLGFGKANYPHRSLSFDLAQLPSRSDRLFQLWRLLLCPFGVKAIQIVVQGFFLKRQIPIRKSPLKNVFNKVVLIDGFGIVFTFKG